MQEEVVRPVRSKQTPSPNRLVVKIGSGRAADAAKRLSALGTVEPLPGTDQLVFQVRGAASQAKDVWRRVLDSERQVTWAAPVVLDEHGGAHFPTGGVSIRFRRKPTPQELERFAKAHRIRVRSRNEFVPEQVTVELLEERDRYLPEVVQEISDEESVLAAWADTLSAFRRR